MTDRYYLSKGKHENAADGRCAMEWVAHLAGEEHSDQPRCVSPVVQLFCISFNDALNDEKRQRLRPYLARTIGTAGDGHDQDRGWLATDWLIRTYTPTWFAFAGLDETASRLRSLPPVLAPRNLESRAMPELRSARLEATAAWATAVRAAASTGSRCAGSSAATTLANNAASVATWNTARAAAKAVAWRRCQGAACSSLPFALAATARRTATTAAKDAAAWTAARHTATTAAWNAAAWAGLGAAASLAQVLKPTVDALQDSAFDLLDRMLPMEVVQLPVVADAEQVCGIPIGS